MKKKIMLGVALSAMCANSAYCAEKEYDYSWQIPQAKVLSNGDLQWQPKPFKFVVGKSIRYIDFENGKDINDGKSKEKPWKHHPWDKNATDNAKEGNKIHSFVFKKGVFYRGKLNSTKSGEIDNPIRLTSDPSWGEGEAYLVGSKRLTGGWKKASATIAPRIPNPEKVWYIDIDAVAQNMWFIENNKTTRIPVCRHPNWNAETSHPDDPHTQWFEWEARKDGINIDTKNLGGFTKDFFKGGIVHTENYVPPFGNMGTETSHKIQKYNKDRKGLVFNTMWLRKGNRYFIENVPGFLDEPGEFYCANKGDNKGGRLFVRLPNDKNPNEAIVEVAVRRGILEILDNDNIIVSGLQFSFDNNGTLKEAFSWPTHRTSPTAIRILGDSSNITISNCKFYNVEAGIVAFPHSDKSMANRKSTEPAFMDNILVSDCDIKHADRRAIQFVEQVNTKAFKPSETPASQIGKIKILRNRIFDVTSRAEDTKYSDISAIDVINVERCEIAGNIIDKCKGAGIDIRGGNSKKNNTGADIKMARNFVHHNKVTNSALGLNDYGGIEGWGAGPLYMYNNVSGNAVGFKNFMFVGERKGKKQKDSFWCTQSPAYYLDGANKSYLFNNIGWGKKGTMEDKYRNQTGYYAVVGMMNHFFNNTLYNFVSCNSGSMGQRASNLGNINISNGWHFIGLNAKGDLGTLGGGTDAGEASSELYSYNYGSNVFHGNPKNGFGKLGRTYDKWLKKNNLRDKSIKEEVENVSKYMKDYALNLKSPGVYSEKMPLNSPEEKDFSLTADSAAKNMGVKFFVPWSLSATVGEWNFYKNGYNYTNIIGENFYFTTNHIDRGMYNQLPTNNLTVVNGTEKAFVNGDLESWISGAVNFDGKLFATYAHSEMTKDYKTELGKKLSRKGKPNKKYREDFHKGEDRKTVHIEKTNMLIEIYFKTEKDGVLVSKADSTTGYVLEIKSGKPVFTIKAQGKECSIVGSDKINDGKWRHLIVEADRNKADGMNVYIDGKKASGALNGKMITGSLGNKSDFFVGKGFVGTIDFLRICQATLKDSDTTIEELYQWQFNGPQYRDFTGKEIKDGKRDAGALEIQ